MADSLLEGPHAVAPLDAARNGDGAAAAQMKIESIRDVVDYQLCTGCGVCSYLSDGRYAMRDVEELGRRPSPLDACATPRDAAFDACPGKGLEHTFDERDPELLRDLLDGWGPVYEVIEAHASDPAIRFAGSSGGAATALSLFALERGGAHGVLHTAADARDPIVNRTVLSTSREDLLAASGSRYSPASPCEGLGLVESAPAPCVFVGKPCDVAAVRRAMSSRPELERKIAFTLAFFCAGVPSTAGTRALLADVGAAGHEILSLRYRGRGWPGHWTVVFRDPEGAEQTRSLTYAQSWGFLQRYRQWRCYICPDHTGEFADVAVGDPWYRDVEPGEHGSSLIVARTPRGRRVLADAIDAGYLTVVGRDPSLLPRSQPNLLSSRGALWGRLLGLRAARAPTPKFERFPMRRFWRSELTMRSKAQSVLGTVRRVFRKRLRHRLGRSAEPPAAR